MTARESFVVGVGLLCALACVRVGGTQERRLVSLDGIPPERALRLAQEYATTDQLASLRTIAKTKYPHLTDADLATLGLRWQRMSLADGEHVMIELTFMPSSPGADAKAVADYLGDQVRRAIRAKLVKNDVSELRGHKAPSNNKMQLTSGGLLARFARLH